MFVRTLLESKERNLITTTPEATLEEAMDLLIGNGIGCLPVLSGSGELVGIISDKDIFKKIHETKGNYRQCCVKEVMTYELIVGLPEDDISYIAGVMDKNWIRHVPILDGEKVVGIVSLRDIIKTTAENVGIENRYLNLYMEMMGRRDKSGDL
ncbi:MAG: CBS domain-containing protein [bacterium]|nr:CBS domain-containing protein [bacterium]